jgi:hypothetical protein
MPSCSRSPRLFCAFTLPVACAALLAACDGTTGGYPPPPPPYQAPAGELDKARAPKFQPLIKGLLAQRKASQGDFSGLAKTTDAEGNRLSAFAASRAASDALTKAVRQAGLTAEEKATWSVISSLDDASLESLLKPN